MMDKSIPFYGPRRRRAVLHDVAAKLTEITRSTIVSGFETMQNAGEAEFSNDRICGFMETADRRQWLLRLSSKKGVIWRSAKIPSANQDHVSFLLNIGFGNGDPLPQPSGQWDIYVNDRFTISIRMVNHSQLWQNDHCRFAFTANRIETAPPFSALTLGSLVQNESLAVFGPAILKVPREYVSSGKQAAIRIEAVCPVESKRWFMISPLDNMIVGADIYGAAQLIANGPLTKLADHHIYFGDIHTHSGQLRDSSENSGCGIGSRQDNYRYAMGPGGLDFYALTDHEFQIDPDNQKDYFELADQFNRVGRFVTLPAFEFTSLLYGHRNVYFKNANGRMLNSNSDGGIPTMDPAHSVSPNDLWSFLESLNTPFFTVPHHSSSTSHPLNLDFYNERYDRLFEIYSSWGSSEYYGDFPRGVSDRYRNHDFRDAIARGLKYGLIASSDGHDGNPGNAQSPLTKHHHIFHFCGSGRAAVLANDLTRESIFDALYDRMCYATTGVPILLDFRINDTIMGRTISQDKIGKYPSLNVKCIGTNGIDKIMVIKNGRKVHDHFCDNEFTCRFQWQDPNYNRDKPTGYYIRVIQKDRESAWSSPIWIL